MCGLSRRLPAKIAHSNVEARQLQIKSLTRLRWASLIRSFELGTNRGLGLEPAVAEPENVIEAVENHFVMRDTNDRSILFDGDPAQQIHHYSGARRVERRGRLICENDARPVGERAGNRDALPLPAGQLRRHRVPTVADLQVVQQLDGACESRRGTKSRKLQHHGDIVGGVEEGQQIGVLENEADLVEPQPAQI